MNLLSGLYRSQLHKNLNFYPDSMREYQFSVTWCRNFILSEQLLYVEFFSKTTSDKNWKLSRPYKFGDVLPPSYDFGCTPVQQIVLGDCQAVNLFNFVNLPQPRYCTIRHPILMGVLPLYVIGLQNTTALSVILFLIGDVPPQQKSAKFI